MTTIPQPMLKAHPTLHPRDAWVLCWSQSQCQCALHVETLDAMFRANASSFHEDRRMDYVALVIGDRELVDAFAADLRSTVHARDRARSDARDLVPLLKTETK